MNRARRGEVLFKEQRDYCVFIELLQEAVDMWRVNLSAYCLIPNHYHLLVETPEGNLSRFMRHVDGVYTQRFNRYYGCDGQLFRGRYKSILVGGNSYLLQLVRYIHRNPLRAQLVERLSEYAWSSHGAYVSTASKWRWLHKDFLLSILSQDKRRWRAAYRDFISMEDSEEIMNLFSRKKFPSVIGPGSFVDWVKERFYDQKRHEEVPEWKSLAPRVERIRQVICSAYDVDAEGLCVSRRGLTNEARNVAIYLTRRLCGETLERIGQEFNMNKYSSVSTVIQTVKMRMSRDKRFRRDVKRLEEQLRLSQQQT
jgi:REP element-mobilizing transposase RayT